ncbi:MAG: FAD-dependent oxidoreductase [Verrucomicrobiota bacterium]
MSSERVHEFDTIIIGGGIAALWTANELKSAGQKIALLCNGPLGDGQTLAAQGVIHGGLKYALGGKLTDASEELAAMPQRWSDALAGKGPVDLSTTAVLSDHQILWTLPKLVSRVAGFFGSKSVRGRSAAIPREEFPEVFARGEYRGSLFRIEEPVVDPVSLVEALAAGVESCSWQVEWGTSAELVAINGSVDSIRLPSEGANVRLRADRYLLLAGSGNEALLQQIGIESPRMQRRPLHQLIIRSQHLPDFYSVCVGTGPKPPLVSTTHTDRAGRRIWYIGGDIAEQAGVARSEADQSRQARLFSPSCCRGLI